MPSADDNDHRKCYDVILHVFKILTYIVVCGGVLILAMFSHGALLLAASNLRPTSNYKPTTPSLRCFQSSEGNLTCISLPRDTRRSYAVDGLSKCTVSSGEPVDANECGTHRVMWGWSLFMMVSMPYAFVFLRNLKRIFCGKYKRPVDWSSLVFVLVIETAYSVGLCLFVFVALPSLDNVLEV